MGWKLSMLGEGRKLSEARPLNRKEILETCEHVKELDLNRTTKMSPIGGRA